jgi:peptide deformylase
MHLIGNKDPLLRKVCEYVDLDKLDELKPIIDEMHQFVRKHNAVGLAAPQIGIDLRLFVLNSTEQFITCINPEISMASVDTSTSPEGCLSFPGLFLKISRPKWINVNWINQDGLRENHNLEDEVAAVWMHEYDHLNGILFSDRAGPVSLMMAKKKLIKAEKRKK